LINSSLTSHFGQVYISKTKELSEKNWNFPKNHTHDHIFQDILAKGVTRTADTRLGEGMHPPVKKFYKLRSNFKKVDGQESICDN